MWQTMASSDEDWNDPFATVNDAFAGLNEMDFELHGIYMDHEPQNEFVRSLDKCKDTFLNVLLNDANLRNASMSDEMRAHIYHSNDWQSDEEHEELLKSNYRVHDPNIRWDKMEPKLGDIFESPAQLKFCVANYAVAHGYQIYFKKCDSVRIVAKCGKRNEENLCPFRLHAAWMYKERSLQIKTMNPLHKCSRSFKFGSIVSPEWIGRHYMTEIANKPKIKLREMITDIKQKFRCQVSIGQCRRAKKWAKDLIEGKLAEHYARIWDYSNELLRSNPGSTCQVGVTCNPDGKNYFHKFYICFKALSNGWKRGCRRVIGLDGCFLKGEVKGELLTAIGRDANNQVYPIAWAVVNVENKPNWTWFLELLNDDLTLDGGRGLVIISDQHKGLLEAVKDILPHVEHRQCARHIYANFRKTYTGLEFKRLFWAAAMSCVEGDFNRHMNEIKKISPTAFEYLKSKEPKTWCRAYFRTGFSCEAVENGISECFNAIILDARKKPLITMLEEIRIYIMDRIAHMSENCSKWNSNVCPAALKKMNLFGKYMRFWLIVHSQGSVFEARRSSESYMVDLERMSCTCRLWDLSGIPCVHATAAINYIHETPYGYISDYFSKEKFVACYESNISPVNGSNLWVETPYLKPLPPVGRRMPGRPATKRRRHPSEKDTKFSTSKVQVSRTVKCGNCLEYGHNKKSCTNETRQRFGTAPKKMGRPRKFPNASGPNQASASRTSNQASGSRTSNQASASTEPNQAYGSTEANQAFGSRTEFKRKKLCVRRQPKQASASRTTFRHLVDEEHVVEVPVVEEPVIEEPVVEEPVIEEPVVEGVQVDVQSMVNDDSQVEFHEGDPSDVLPDKIQVNEEDLALLLEAGYTMAELEASRGLQMPLDDMPAVEMDLDDGEGHPDEDFNQEEDGEEHPNKEADPDNEGVKNLPKMKRKASERILKMKLKKVVYDADGGGSNSTTPVILE
ncbi:hypothetical protein L1887_24793 [Cichorium endivia]|nr:hypothetical protein L1887_24793 [Cichorium endivia]